MRNLDKLDVYRYADRLAIEVYRCTASLPVAERYGLVTQMRRAAVSIASNIAEGSARTSDNDFARYLEIALGSARELAYQIHLTERLHLAQAELATMSTLCDETTRMLGALVYALRRRSRVNR
ncbi:MAG: four helix bundle protein [Steroidobacteraceae bacterium]